MSLNPEWVTNAVYKMVNSKEVAEFQRNPET